MTRPLWTVAADGSVTWAFAEGAKGGFDADDALSMEMGGKKMTAKIDDAGSVTLVSAGKTDSPPWKVVNMSRPARRAAILLSLSVARKKKD
jgi:hypothetical protein